MSISVDVLRLGAVELPSWHPRATDGTCIINGYAVRHPDGVVVFDTGTSDDHPVINDLYRPTVTPVVEALNGAGIDERDVTAIVNSHLHFDHCGQNRALPQATVFAQRAEYDLIDEPMFTVPEWAHTDAGRLRLVDGDEQLADGVRIVATPGHTPGHQSLVVDVGARSVVLAGQCCYDGVEFDRVSPEVGDLHLGEAALAEATSSIRRLRSFGPDVVHLSHDPTPWRPS